MRKMFLARCLPNVSAIMQACGFDPGQGAEVMGGEQEPLRNSNHLTYLRLYTDTVLAYPIKDQARLAVWLTT